MGIRHIPKHEIKLNERSLQHIKTCTNMQNPVQIMSGNDKPNIYVYFVYVMYVFWVKLICIGSTGNHFLSPFTGNNILLSNSILFLRCFMYFYPSIFDLKC